MDFLDIKFESATPFLNIKPVKAFRIGSKQKSGFLRIRRIAIHIYNKNGKQHSIESSLKRKKKQQTMRNSFEQRGMKERIFLRGKNKMKEKYKRKYKRD